MSLNVPELKQMYIPSTTTSYGLDLTREILETVYVLKENEDLLYCCVLLTDCDGFNYYWSEPKIVDCEGLITVTWEKLNEVIGQKELNWHIRRMDSIIQLKNSDAELLSQMEDYNLQSNYEDDGQPTEQEEIEYYEGIEHEIYPDY